MNILLVADGRSPHTVGWIRGMTRLGIVATLLSSRLLDRARLAMIEDLLGPGRVHHPNDLWNQVRHHITINSPARKALRYCTRRWAGEAGRRTEPGAEPALASYLESYGAWRLQSQLNSIVETSRPDAIHALRVQHEAIAAARARTGLPLAVSTWGQDLVLSAQANRLLSNRTREALRHANVLMSDCERDAQLAREWGLPPNTPTHVIPGNFGVDLDRFPNPDPEFVKRLGLVAAPLVVFPRGLTGYVNHHGFVKAVKILLSEGVEAAFLALGLESAIEPGEEVPGLFRCIGKVDHESMLKIAASSAVTVSPSWSDGMPNSVLEGMAGGSIPACGDIASLRELERHGAVMSWCDPSRADSIAFAIRRALELCREPANRALNRKVVVAHYSTTVALRAAQSAYRELATAL
jgi:hypothetical protein